MHGASAFVSGVGDRSARLSPLRVTCVGVAVAIVAVTLLLAWPRGDREPAGLISLISVSSDGRSLSVAVASCHGEPELEAVESFATVVVSATVVGQDDETRTCADIATVRLRTELGDRTLVDGVAGEPFVVRGAKVAP